MRTELFELSESVDPVRPFKKQLLKWIGNKQRFAPQIISLFPNAFGTYFEPFLGSAGVLGSLSPQKAVGSDCFKPLVQIWQTLRSDPEKLKRWYRDRWLVTRNGQKIVGYEKIKASYNAKPNPADLLFISRSCYGGVVRFRKADGYISTPCGIHDPIEPTSFNERVNLWHQRTKGTEFVHAEYEQIMDAAKKGDLIYCDPPYSHSQAILYGAQTFSLENLFAVIERCKSRGVWVALSIDGTKRSGNKLCDLPIPPKLFEREVMISIGRSMLKRFQMDGKSLEEHEVADRLLLTY
jgi:DNA adenine methylase